MLIENLKYTSTYTLYRTIIFVVSEILYFIHIYVQFIIVIFIIEHFKIKWFLIYFSNLNKILNKDKYVLTN